MATTAPPQPTTTPAPQAASAAAPAAAAAPNSANAATPSNANASGSLYVGDLQPDVTEALLFEIFNQVGPVSSIRVCRDAATRRSLGYAYVNFHNVVDAERALDTINFHPIKNRPCRIMWSHRDPSIRKNSNSNIFIKNLDRAIDNKALFDTFSAFGNILSCKVATDASLQSKGYGFVHYETEEAAAKAIEKVNGFLLNGKPVYVGKFERRSERSGSGPAKFTNVYVKNIPEEWDEAKLREEFSKFGTITSILLRTQDNDETKHRGFGFVNYEEPEQALLAVEEGSKVSVGENKTLFVDRFQKRAERSAILAQKHEDMRREKNEKYKNLNLYVKNLDDDVDDEKLKGMFAEFGEISSAVVQKDDKGVSRGFGFVCFTNPEDATKALTEMNGKMFGTKPIYVNRFQRREERRMQLESQFQANIAGQRLQPMQPVFYPPSQMMQPGMMYPQQVMRGRYPPMRYPMGGYPQQAKPRRNQPGGPARPAVAGGNRPAQQKFRGGYPARNPHDQMQVSAMQVPPTVAAPIAPQAVPPQHSELTSPMLANMAPEVQKQILGERLFPLIQQQQPELAGKITGMLLEMEVSEILTLLDSPSDLKDKITEAMEVLESHQQ